MKRYVFIVAALLIVGSSYLDGHEINSAIHVNAPDIIDLSGKS